MKSIGVVDTTLRDAQQSLWATRMTTAMMLPVAERMGRVGYTAIDLMGSIQFDVCVRFLKENPWERIRLIKKLVGDTPLKAGVRSKSLVTFRILPDDLVHHWVERLVVNGLGKLSPFDALFDLDNIIDTIKVARAAGADAGAALVFCESPVHTDALYAQKARELVERVGIDHLMLKDSGGLLTPDRVRTLVPALKSVLGDVPIELHSHCMTGLAPLVYLEGIKAGADVVHTATAPLANGASQPATQTVARNLRSMGYDVAVDDGLIEEIGEYFREVAEREHKPVGVPVEYDAYHFEHQMPGGMITNLKSQLQDAGLLDKLDDVIRESVDIRRELGWPIMVTPFAQFVITQAVYNIMHGERYRIVPDEVKKYALGYYGKLLAPVEPDILDRIVENGSKAIAIKPEPLAPVMADLRRKYPNMSDEERMMRFMFVGSQVDEMLTAEEERKASAQAPLSLSELIEEVIKLPRVGAVRVHTPSLKFEIGPNQGAPA